MQSPFYRAMGGPHREKLVEFGETVLAHLPEVGKGSGNPAPKLEDRWKPGVWLGKTDLTDEHLVRTDDGVVYARSVRRLAENSWSEENLKAVVETPQKPRSMTTDDASDPRVVPEAHEQESPNEEANENHDESGETHRQARRRGSGNGGRDASRARHSSDVELKPKRETHRNTRKRVRETTVDGEVTKTTYHISPTS